MNRYNNRKNEDGEKVGEFERFERAVRKIVGKRLTGIGWSVRRRFDRELSIRVAERQQRGKRRGLPRPPSFIRKTYKGLPAFKSPPKEL